MNMTQLLHPVSFFALSFDCLYSKDRETKLQPLPVTTPLTNEKSFAIVSMGWNEKGLLFHVQVKEPMGESFYPGIEEGDSVELFLDTRDIKSSGHNTKFCHHFFFLPKSVDGVSRGEKTHFRGEDSHPLCDAELLECTVKKGKGEYTMHIFIPAPCLYGYNPSQCSKLGFTYRINRYRGSPQHFSVVTQDYSIEEQPSLWASLSLI